MEHASQVPDMPGWSHVVKPAEVPAVNGDDATMNPEPVLPRPPRRFSYRPPNLDAFRKAQQTRIEALLKWFEQGGTPDKLLESPVYQQLIAAHPASTDPTWSLARSWIDRHLQMDNAIRSAFARRKVEGLDPVIDLCRLCLTETPQYAIAYRVDADYRTALQDMAEPESMYLRPEMEANRRAPIAFQLLMFIYAHQRRFDEAIDICRVAEREGWQGDWKERTARLDAMKWKTGQGDRRT
jgi:tetratricopeptide (TPR) repeat protein